MIEALFFRGTAKIGSELVADPPPFHFFKRHTPPMSTLFKFEDFPSEGMTEYREVFQLANWKCPNCNCVVYNSQNYLELPSWALFTKIKP